MSRLLRRYLIPALVVALTGTGVSFATAGGVGPFQHDTTQVSNNQDDTTTEVASTESDETNEEATTQDEETDELESSESNGPVRFTEGCPEGTTNHGQYVSQSEDKQAAAHSPCGKPIHAVDKEASNHPDDNDAPETEQNEHEDQGKHLGQQGSNPHEHEDDEGESG